MKPLVLLARHGHTAGNEAHIFRSRLDFPLSSQGEEDARQLGQVAAHFQPSVIVSSPMSRALKTAQIVGAHTGAPVEKSGNLMPWNAGLLTGRKRDVKSEKVRDFYVQNAHLPIPGGESIENSEGRMKKILTAAMSAAHQGHMPMLVTHGSGIKAAETIIKGKRTQTGDAALVEPGGLAGIFQTDKGFEIRPLFKEGTAGQVTS